METSFEVQLQMRYVLDPRAGVRDLPPVSQGFLLRGFQDTDIGLFLELMGFSEWSMWDAVKVESCRTRSPGAWFVVEDLREGALVASAVGLHAPTEEFPERAELGWVFVSPEHRGRRIGRLVCAAVLGKLTEQRYRPIDLYTDDSRLAALRTYLKLGFEPLLYTDGMEARWGNVFRELGETAPFHGEKA